MIRVTSRKTYKMAQDCNLRPPQCDYQNRKSTVMCSVDGGTWCSIDVQSEEKLHQCPSPLMSCAIFGIEQHSSNNWCWQLRRYYMPLLLKRMSFLMGLVNRPALVTQACELCVSVKSGETCRILRFVFCTQKWALNWQKISNLLLAD